MTDAAIKADYATYRPVPSRKVLQIVLEVPLEEQAHVFGVLGYPTAGQSKWVGVALLNVAKGGQSDTAPPPSVSDEGSDSPVQPKKSFRDMPRSTQAALKCKDPEFQTWLRMTNPRAYKLCDEKWNEEACCDWALKASLVISSKKELDEMESSAADWDKILTSFDMRHLTR